MELLSGIAVYSAFPIVTVSIFPSAYASKSTPKAIKLFRYVYESSLVASIEMTFSDPSAVSPSKNLT